MKKILLLVVAMLMLLLTGCSGIGSYLEKQIEKQSGLKADTSYQVYQSYAEKGFLDQDGYYKEEVFETEAATTQMPANSARVSFSSNGYLKIRYYSDPAFEQELRMQDGTLQLGDTVYASVALGKNVSSSAYEFSGFRLSEIDEDGERIQLKVIEPLDDGLILQITDEYIGKDLAIDPLGAYASKQVSFKSSYYDNDEREHDLAGTWIVNDKPVSEGVAEINPVSSYIISYEFDGKEYFFLSSEPECYYSNSEDGIVIFNKRESTDETVDYSVQLHQYVNIAIETKQSRHVSVNNGFEQEIKAGSSLEITRLKYGEKVVIVSDTEWKDLETCRELVYRSMEPKHQSGQTAYVYTMSVPEKDSVFIFDPSEYKYAHGTITFMCYGEEVTSKVGLAEGRKITYVQSSSDNGYWLPGGDHTITVTTAEATKRQLESIQFVEKERVTVQLKQPSSGGRIEYYVNGVRQCGTEYKGDSGTEITMKFFPWEGWINNYINGAKYVMTSASSQTVKIGGKEVHNTAFTESSDHKPTLEVVLSKSVGENMHFEFEASDLDRKDYKYEDGWFRSDYTVISKQQIGTEKGVTISMGNRAIQAGTAVKISVEMTGEDKSGNKTQKVNTSYYRLVDSLTDLQEPIDIYSTSEMGSSSIWYKTVKITISVVDVMKLSMPLQPANATLTVRNYETSKVLKDGDILERSEKVTVTISANNGYYVSGKGVKNDVYQTTVKFEKCIAELQKMIADHPIKKYLQVTLNSQDAYGTCTYKLNGNVVTGTINVKPDDEISLEYTITNSDYIIDGASGFLGTPIGKNEKSDTKSIEIDTIFDAKTLSRDSFGILVKKGA